MSSSRHVRDALNLGEILARYAAVAPPGQRHSYIMFTTRSSETDPAQVAALVSCGRDLRGRRLAGARYPDAGARRGGARAARQGQRLGSTCLTQWRPRQPTGRSEIEVLRAARHAYNGACGVCLPDARWRAQEWSDGMTAGGTTLSRRRLAKVTGNDQYTPTSSSGEC